MRIMHISDLHIGIKLYRYDLMEDQAYMLHKMVALVEEQQPDVLLIAGDIYDKAVPSADAVKLFDDFLEQLHFVAGNMEIMSISGNHDSGKRIDMYHWVLSKYKLHMVGVPPQKEADKIQKVTLWDSFGPVNFYLLPFVRPAFVRHLFDEETLSYEKAIAGLLEREEMNVKERNVLLSHQFYLPTGKKAEDVERMSSETKTVGNIDAVSTDLLEPFDYAALGHIHKPMKAGDDRFRYCGSPMPYSVDEAGQEKGALLITLGSKQEAVRVERLPMEPLHQIRVLEDTFEHVIGQPSEDYVQIILTDEKGTEILDMQDRLKEAFPRLLEVKRKYRGKRDLTLEYENIKDLEPLELICEFIPDMKEDEDMKALLQDVMNEAMGEIG